MAQVKFYGEIYDEEYPENKSVAYISEEDGFGEPTKGRIVLPHSCDEWIIGGEEEARELIKDLEELIKKLNN